MVIVLLLIYKSTKTIFLVAPFLNFFVTFANIVPKNDLDMMDRHTKRKFEKLVYLFLKDQT